MTPRQEFLALLKEQIGLSHQGVAAKVALWFKVSNAALIAVMIVAPHTPVWFTVGFSIYFVASGGATLWLSARATRTQRADKNV